MRIVPDKFLIVLIGCLLGMVSFASNTSVLAVDQNPPPPTPPPPGLPIDGGVMLLLVIGLAFAFYKYKNTLNINKTPK